MLSYCSAETSTTEYVRRSTFGGIGQNFVSRVRAQRTYREQLPRLGIDQPDLVVPRNLREIHDVQVELLVAQRNRGLGAIAASARSPRPGRPPPASGGPGLGR
ncbi:hypothetical protein GCM10023176_45850 [Micromonospora coerulea]|uniref:Uncharacterized protein n=1 Tax=Micromonospora coerulea TaxID=47856 RepID=A0ABP8SU52_9ACTN